MKHISELTQRLIEDELGTQPMEMKPRIYSTLEGQAMISKKVIELEAEIFFGLEKRTEECYSSMVRKADIHKVAREMHRLHLQKKATELAATVIRFIQESTTLLDTPRTKATYLQEEE